MVTSSAKSSAVHKEIPIESNDLPGKTLLRPDEVAAFFRVCVKTVYRWYAEEKLEGVNLGKALRVYRKSVIELLDKSKPDYNQ